MRDTSMAFNRKDLWQEAFSRCRSQLSAKEATRILQTTTYEQLKSEMAILQAGFKQKMIPRVLGSIEPFLQNLRTFNGVIDTAVQANPDIASLIWGGIKLILELALRLSGAIENVVQGMTDIGRALPRFESYQAILPNAPRLDQALVDVYESVVQFCIETIKFLRANPMKSFFRSLWTNYENTLAKRVSAIEKRSREVDKESYAANMEVDKSRHEEIKRLITHPLTAIKGHLPYFQIPLPKNTGFFSREDELRQCRTALDYRDGPPSLKFFALHGPGGVGKSSIALQFSYEEKLVRRVILWLLADDETKLIVGFGQATKSLGLHDGHADANADCEALKSWLATTSEPWLIVFDNLENPALLRKFLPEGGSGAILITSRNPDTQYGLQIEGCKVPVFSLEEGKMLLKGFIPGLPASLDIGEKAALQSIAERLDGLPLALKQVGGFLRETNCTMEDLLTMMNDKDQEREILQDATGFSSLGYSHALLPTFGLSLSRLDDSTRNLMGLFSFLDPDTIPGTLVKSLSSTCATYSNLFPNPINDVRLFRSIRTLIRYGLVEQQQNNALKMHRVIQATTLHCLSPSLRLTMFNVIIDVLYKIHPQSQITVATLFNKWELCASYAAHISRLHGLQGEWLLQPSAPERLWSLLYNSGRYMLETGSMAQAITLIQDALQLCDLDTKEGLVQAASVYSLLGIIHMQHQKLVAARECLEKAWEIRKAQLGDLDSRTQGARSNMSLLLVNEKRWTDLIAFNLPQREFIESQPPDTVSHDSSTYDHLSVAYLKTNQLDEALKHNDISSHMVADKIPAYSQYSGYLHYYRGLILAAQGSLPEALREMNLSIHIRKKVLGDHIQTAASYYRAGDLLDRAGESTDAAQLIIESMRMYGNLKLIGSFAKGGEARSAWRLAQIVDKLGNTDEGNRLRNEVDDIRDALGLSQKENYEEEDFNILLNQMDS